MVIESLALQPNASVPVTLYLVRLVGLTTTCAPVADGGFHAYVVAPLAVRVTDDALQTLLSASEQAISG